MDQSPTVTRLARRRVHLRMRILKLTSRGRRSVSAERAESKPQEEEEERSCGARCEPAGRAVAFFAVLVRDPPGLDVFPTHEDRVLIVGRGVSLPFFIVYILSTYTSYMYVFPAHEDRVLPGGCGVKSSFLYRMYTID